MASAHGTIVQSILHDKNWSHSPLYVFRFFQYIKTPHLSDQILSDKWGVVHFEKRFGFSILTAVLPLDIPTGWEPRAKQQPTGLIAYGAAHRRPVQVLFRTEKEKPVHIVYWFFLVQ